MMPAEGVHVLVVDGDCESSGLMRAIVPLNGLHVTLATNTAAALEALLLAHFDLVLHDLTRADAEGLALAASVRGLPHSGDLPLVAVAGRLAGIAEADAVAAGYDALLVKPVSSASLLETVRHYVARPAGDDEEAGCAMEDAASAEETFSAAFSVLGVVADALSRGGNPAEALRAAFLNAINHAGLTTAALCLAGSDGVVMIEPAIGLSADALVQLRRWLSSLMAAAHDDQSGEWTVTLGAQTCRVFPLAYHGETVGALVVGIDASGATGVPALVSSGVLPTVLSQSLVLVRTFERSREFERRFHQMTDHVGEVLFLMTPDNTQILYVSRAYEEIWQRSCQSLYETPLSWMQLIHPDDRAVVDQGNRHLHLEGRFAYEYRIIRDDGTVRWIAARGFPIYDEHGVLYRVAGVAEDITAHRQAIAELRESEMRFRQLAENISAVFFLVDARTDEVLYVSPSYATVWGKSCQSLRDRPSSWFDVVHPDDRDRVARTDTDSGRAAGFEHEYRIVRPDGQLRWIRARGFPIRNSGGDIYRIVAVAEDITERKEQHDKIVRLGRFRSVVASLTTAMMKSGERDELLREACRVSVDAGVFAMAWAGVVDTALGTGRVVASHGGDLAGSQPAYFSTRVEAAELAHPATRAVLVARPVIVNDVSTDPTLLSEHDELHRRGHRSMGAFPVVVDQRVVAVLVLYADALNYFEPEEVELLQWIVDDLAVALDRIENKARLEYLAYFDDLTGLPNAMLFRDRLAQFLHASAPGHDRISVVLIDLDHFRQVNELLGRSTADELLRAVARRLDASLKEPYTFARVGSDLFALATPIGEDDAAALLQDTVFAALDEPFVSEGRAIRLTAHAGIALFPVDGQSVDALYSCAEAALKQAKRSTERFQYFSREVNERIAEKLALEEELRTGIAQDQFVMHFQPRVDLTTGLTSGAEALIRWRHPTRGLLSPEHFIHVAEESGMIVAIGEWIVRSVCAQQAAWLAAGVHIVPITINVSATQLLRGDLLRTVRDALGRSGLSPKFLELELTETAVMQDIDRSVGVLQAISQLGIGLAMDDFGTGYSSLAQLKRLPFSTLKLDRMFIADISQNVEDATIAAAIIAMAHRLRQTVIAEGVETQAQLNFLVRHECDEIQGHYFSPALAADAFLSLLRSGKRLAMPVPENNSARTVLVVDDDAAIRAALQRLLRREGYRILTAASGPQGLEVLAVNPVQVIISDQRMSGMSGAAFLDTAKDLYPDTVRIMLSGYPDLAAVTESVNRGGIFRFLTKPWNDDHLREQVREAFRTYRQRTSV
ncbi:EAL domain-containing protein [Tahibacter amnicola]|uniref:EAL domain-containing protein n=1 Tax=Tahibacter amnicola TaxID=2976241 RepID=A0ABY6BAQ5_9GAMM|nr:EAL domain-containing protein [Tahibacter amnicola]UXI67146.1 EAL domain-containing protein [Tahibacter amnicola]